jgi:hypothetical protein
MESCFGFLLVQHTESQDTDAKALMATANASGKVLIGANGKAALQELKKKRGNLIIHQSTHCQHMSMSIRRRICIAETKPL